MRAGYYLHHSDEIRQPLGVGSGKGGHRRLCRKQATVTSFQCAPKARVVLLTIHTPISGKLSGTLPMLLFGLRGKIVAASPTRRRMLRAPVASIQGMRSDHGSEYRRPNPSRQAFGNISPAKPKTQLPWLTFPITSPSKSLSSRTMATQTSTTVQEPRLK